MYRCLASLTLVALLAAPVRAEDKPGFLGVQVKADEVSGKVNVFSVFADSPAEKAGLKAGDVILKLGDKEATSIQEFVNEVKKHKPGDKVKLTYKRDEETKTVEIKLEKPPENFEKKP